MVAFGLLRYLIQMYQNVGNVNRICVGWVKLPVSRDRSGREIEVQKDPYRARQRVSPPDSLVGEHFELLHRVVVRRA